MCGIAGFINQANLFEKDKALSACKAMCESLLHRGPDSSGIWADQEAGVFLGLRRLAILDLSETGSQPMVSSSGRYVIALNGEIYNFRSLRKELESAGCSFKGTSDTEAALFAIELWGFEKAVKRFNGMFAIALWDRRKRCLVLARDRLGEKPLYYGWAQKSFVFASELKAIRQFPGFKPELNPESLDLYLRYAYIPAPHSIYKKIYKLMPGRMLVLKDFSPAACPEEKVFWSTEQAAQVGIENKFKGTKEEAAANLEILLKEAVKIRLESDVPLGVLLSGGIDSSLVTAIAQKESGLKVKTFTAGFSEKSHDEAKKGAKIAAHLGTEHTELHLRPENSLEVIPKLPDIYDEPFADPSAIPTFLISRLTRSHVKTVLTGDGGDELFAGYNRYFWAVKAWDELKRLPFPLRNTAARLLRLTCLQTWDYFGKSFLPDDPHRKITNLSGILDAPGFEALYEGLLTFWHDPSIVLQNRRKREPPRQESIKGTTLTESMMYRDLTSYLPDDILVKVDRASMAVGLEARPVFLDHRIVESAFALPEEMKIQGNSGKLILKKLLSNYLPDELISQEKKGFSFPLHSWLRAQLRPWAEDLLSKRKIENGGFLKYGPIKKRWDEYLSGKRNWHYHLWIILMFQAWKEEWL